jgi:hypothetical protein
MNVSDLLHGPSVGPELGLPPVQPLGSEGLW